MYINFKENELTIFSGNEQVVIDIVYFDFSNRENIVPVVCLGDPRFSLTIRKIEVTTRTVTTRT